MILKICCATVHCVCMYVCVCVSKIGVYLAGLNINPLVPALCLMCLVLSGGGVTREEDGTVAFT